MDYFGDNWIRVFDISETSQLLKKFTIYKIISIVYPKSCPDAVTKVTVWKRYNDFKKLHRELKVRYKSLQIKEKYPTLISSSYFRRFDSEIINQRRNSALAFLEFVAQHPPLFKCTEFVKFFESSHTPQESLNSNINIIRAQLNLPSDPEIIFPNYNSDDDVRSDSDSVSTFSSISTSANKDDAISLEQKSTDLEKKLSSSFSNLSKISSQDSSSTSSHSFHELSIDNCTTLIYPTPPLTPESLLNDFNNPLLEYLTNAAQYITKATEFEIEKKYEQAFDAYKSGISCLLTGVKDDSDAKRRQMVRHKTEVYLLRAEKIYNLYLSQEMNQIRESIRKTDSEISNCSTKRPLNELFDYKVLKVINTGMVVLHKKEHNLFYMKVIEKHPQTPVSVYINIPKEVPYMVKLFQYYDSLNAVFIVTQYINGDRLYDYIKRKSTFLDSGEILKYSNIPFEREIDQDSGNFDELHSDSSECSYSDLVTNYVTKKMNIPEGTKLNNANSINSSEIDISQMSSTSEIFDMDQNVTRDEFFIKSSSSTGDLVSKSKQLITSVSDSLLQLRVNDVTPLQVSVSENKVVQHQYSEKSFSAEEFSCIQYVSSLEDIVKWASQLLLALEQLHKYGITITDLNPNNLLIDDDENLRLTFMCSFQASNKLFCYKSEDNFYCAPEVFSFGAVTFAADWWSYGVILFELLTGMPLNSVHTEGISDYTILKIPKYVSPEGKSLLRQLLIYEPRVRLGCGVNGTDDIKSHPFFHGVNWDDLRSKGLL